MVTLPSSLPVLRLPGREVTHYTEEWIASAVRAAAERAGNPHAWFADDVAAGVFAHLRSSSRGSTVTLSQIHGKIVFALATVGLEDIAAALVLPAPTYHLGLDRIAELTPLELPFFAALRREVEPAFQSGTPLVICSGLDAAVRILNGTKRWSHRCEKLRLEVVEFVSAALAAFAKELPDHAPAVTFVQSSPLRAAASDNL